ncbi:MAG: transglutaminase-like domain-containing protein [Bacteroides sp.]|nr:transglutaminase-like domain-containing protein [Bacteroides sp.]
MKSSDIFIALKIIIILLYGVVTLCSCQKKTFNLLEEALTYASENRFELEKVLYHYKDDTLKYKAACFLIENMPGHYSFENTFLLKNYFGELDSVLTMGRTMNYEEIDTLYIREISKYENDFSHKVEDVKFISSEYLIKNIDFAYKVWKEEPWSTHLTFDEFCEYLLPYKVVEGQALDDWREYSLESYNQSLVNLSYCSLYEKSAYAACNIVTENMRQDIFPRIWPVSFPPVKPLRTLLKIPCGTCEEYSIMATAVLRAKGIPCAIDLTPQWPFRNMGHVWNVLLENTGKTSAFEGANTPAGTPHKKDHKMAKVYRMTYAKNKELKRLNEVEKRVPQAFKTPFLKDVTEEYMNTTDIFVRLNEKTECKYAYLSVFNNEEWIPVAWGRREGDGFLFEKVGKDIVYLPVLYASDGIYSLSDPIKVDLTGKKILLTPDTINRQTLKLYRKYPSMPYSYGENLRILGAKIQAAHTANFEDSVTIHTFLNLENEIELKENNQKYRYWRYYSSHYGFVNVAELAFYERDSIYSTIGRVIGTKGSYRREKIYEREAVFDGNLLTFFDAPTPSDSWIGMDFGKPINISRITCIMRGDGNNIETDNEYELFFWSKGCFQSLGKRKTHDVFLSYKDCPTNALFLLRCLTKGKEERIFTYREGKQEWW